jgi:hypothetical protein
MSGRQAWLRDPDRVRSSSLVDPRPLEAAVLEPRADTMRDMVRQYVNQRTLDDSQVDEPFLDDEDFDIENAQEPYSDYQLSEMESDAIAQFAHLREQPGAEGESIPEGDAKPSAQEAPTVPA